MSRFVDNGAWLMSLSTVVGGLSTIAILFFGAPPVTIFVAYLVLMAVGSVAQDRDTRRRR